MNKWKMGDITHLNHLIGFNQTDLFFMFDFGELDQIFDFMGLDFE
jgi:hypothetical protein